MKRTVTVLIVALPALVAEGCELGASGSPAPVDAAASGSPVPPASPSALPSSTSPPLVNPSASGPSQSPGELTVLKLVFASDVKDKEPVDRLNLAEPGQRVWAHLTMRNRGAVPRAITVVFRVNGEMRSKVDLQVDPSWSYRTWAYNTLRKEDSGVLVVEIVDGEGTVVHASRLPIAPTRGL
jgi:hypothetical protein